MTNTETVWEIPEPLAIHEVRMDDGNFIILRRHGNPSGPRLILCHGNGLAIDLYYPFWSLLTEEFDVIVHDLRNHGWNNIGSRERHNLPIFVEDYGYIVEAIDRQFGQKPNIGVFHSVSALASLLSPAHGRMFAARVLFDPPVCKADEYPEEFDVATRRCTEIAQRRTERFESFEECSEFLGYLPSLKRVVPGALELYARTILRKSANGQGYVLRCPREYEAQVINHARAFAVMVDFDEYQCPTKVLGADPVLPYSYLPTFDLSHILNVDYDFLPESTHFLQIEQPKECVEAMREFLESLDLLH